jgi:hypothetical protein
MKISKFVNSLKRAKARRLIAYRTVVPAEASSIYSEAAILAPRAARTYAKYTSHTASARCMRRLLQTVMGCVQGAS